MEFKYWSVVKQYTKQLVHIAQNYYGAQVQEAVKQYTSSYTLRRNTMEFKNWSAVKQTLKAHTHCGYEE